MGLFDSIRRFFSDEAPPKQEVEVSTSNLTPRAQQVLTLARKEAERLNHSFVGTEHLLLGLIKLGQGVAVDVLQKRNLDLDTVRMEVEKQVGTAGPSQRIVGSIPYAPGIKEVLVLAAKEAKATNHTYVGTEHILLGLLHEGGGGARVLKNLDVNIEQSRQEILNELDPNRAAQEELGAPDASQKDQGSKLIIALGGEIPIKPNPAATEIEADLLAQPLSRDRLDLLLIDPDHLPVFKTTLEKAAAHQLVVPPGRGHLFDLTRSVVDRMKCGTIRLEDIVWALEVDKVGAKAETAAQNKQFADAICLYRQALRLAPGCDLYLMSVGSCYAGLDRFDLALRYVERAAAINPGNPRIERNLSQLKTVMAESGKPEIPHESYKIAENPEEASGENPPKQESQESKPSPAPAKAGKDPLPDFFSLTSRFLGTRSLEEARLFLIHQPYLLRDYADVALAYVADRQHDENARRFIEAHRQLLQRCREIGIDAAIAEIKALDPQQHFEQQKRYSRGVDCVQLLQRLRGFVDAKTLDERRQLVTEQPDLTFDEASGVMAKLGEDEASEERRQTIHECRTLLERCKEIGIAAAFAEIGQVPRAKPAQPLGNASSNTETDSQTSAADREGNTALRSTVLPIELVSKLIEMMDVTFANALEVQAGYGVVTSSVDLSSARAVVEVIDGCLKQHPGDVSLLLAKSSALRIMMQMKSAEEIVDEILARDPNQSDARLIKDEWNTWPHLLQRPPCWVGMTKMSIALRQAASDRSVVLVRDGISLGVALIQDVSDLRFARELTESMRCKWEFVPSDTPYGRIIAHYVFVEDAPNCSYLRENILQTGRPAKADGISGYWLLQRLAQMTSSLIVLVDGDKVLYSNRYSFPEKARMQLKAIAKLIDDDPKPCRSRDDLPAATKWHTDHFNDNTMRF
jgi:tetratricopeptide (TPR) repeat protein